jgi:putative phosphoesterase
MSTELAKVAIISDTHEHLDERIVELIRDCDYAIHAGDIGCSQVLEKMQPRLGKIAVAGNNDTLAAWRESEAEVVAGLPAIAELHLPGGRIAVEHGHRHGHHKPCHDALRQAHPGARAVVYGHTHKLVCDTSQARWVINPGAAGQTRNHGGPSCLILTASAEQWQVESVRFSDEPLASNA